MHKNIRFAEKTDVKTILRFIRELAKYEKMEDLVVADEALLTEWIFEKQKAEVLLKKQASVKLWV